MSSQIEPQSLRERLLEAPWRPGRPWRPRRSRLRQWGTSALLLFLCSLIGGYIYITDEDRVRSMAQSYLSDLVGGRVEVGRAKLSIFEGLSLGDVRAYVDDRTSPESLLFSAETILVKYNPRVLLRGRLAADQILAIAPHVHLTENLDEGSWNYQRLVRPSQPAQMPQGAPGRPLALPEVLLRSAQVHYSQLKQGKYSEQGSLAVEAQLIPTPDEQRYEFEVQTRGESDRAGARVSGWMARGSAEYRVTLEGFEFGRDVMAVLPAEARAFLTDHELSGRINLVDLTYSPRRPDRPPEFRVEIELDGVTLIVRPQEWMGRSDQDRREALRLAYTYMARLSSPLRPVDEPREPLSQGETARLHPPAETDPYRRMLAAFDLVPLQVRSVAGRFVFNKDGVEIRQVHGRVADHALVVDGWIQGYTPMAPAWLRIASDPAEHLEVKPNPSYMRSLPHMVRNLHQHLRPQGLCDVSVEMKREQPGGRPLVSGYVQVINGAFVFDRFAYPVRQVTGRISFGQDPATGVDAVWIEQLQGLGVAGGPNANAVITLTGAVLPLDAHAGVDVTVRGTKVSSEPALRAAFPAEVRQALSIFDPDGKGESPQFSGDFSCHIVCPHGPGRPWEITTDIALTDGNGRLTFFPYPLQEVKGRLVIHDDYLDVIDMGMARGAASLRVDGRVRWMDPRDASTPHPMRRPIIIRPDLKIVARGVPLDADLLGAMQPSQRQWIERLGIGGVLDFDGRVQRRDDAANDAPVSQAITHGFGISLRDGWAWLVDGSPVVKSVSAKMHLTSDQLVISEASGVRGVTPIAGRCDIDWSDSGPQVALSVTASDLLLDKPLYDIVGDGARRAWDQVQPEGSIDLAVTYRSRLPVGPATTPVREGDGGQLAVAVTPRELSATVQAVPYRLDGVRGSVTVEGDMVKLDDLTARHGPATVRLSGTGSTAADGAWDLRLAGEDVPVDQDLLTALPVALGSLLESVSLAGKASFAFSKLQVRGEMAPRPVPATASADQAAQPSTQPSNLDAEFDVALAVGSVSADLGVPVSDVSGQARLAGAVRRGMLDELTGSFDLPTIKISAREGRDFHGELRKESGNDTVRISPLRGQLAGGEMAGQIELAAPEKGPSRYALSLILRDADVRQVAGEVEQQISGQLTASLAMEGSWSEASQRRGRGEVSVTGREMYKIPLVLGLLQITNLSLPVSSPFSQASIAYVVDGQRVTFEQIVLRSRDMLMEGSGYLDFDSRAVRMSFSTDNPNWPNLPIIGPLVDTAKREMLQIQVRGTIQDPKVSATPAATFSTTVDEVLRGQGR
jgi:hypothetical protein